MGGKISYFESPVHTSSIPTDPSDRHSRLTSIYNSGRASNSNNCKQIGRVIRSQQQNDYGIVNQSASFEVDEEEVKTTNIPYPNSRTELRDMKRKSCSNPDLLSIATPQSSSYVDPIMEEMNFSPPPPLPPRLCSERRSMRDQREAPRITPICKNGLKLSDTHYFVIPAPRRKLDSRGRSFNNEYLNVARKNSRPRYLSDSVTTDDTVSAQLTDLTIDNPIYMSATQVISTPQNNSQCPGHPHHYSRSPKDTVPEHCVQNELIESLCKSVPSATEQEVTVTLIGANWKLDEATKRLKEELLCRTGYACRSRVNYFLKENDWDLEAAVRQAKEEHERWKPLYQQQ